MTTTTSQTLGPEEYSESVPGAPLETVLCGNELHLRLSKPRDPELLSAATKQLIHGLSASPQTVLQSLSDTILEILQCDSAGVSLVNDDNTRFVWPAISGAWKPHIGGGTPRHFGPCGDVLHFNHPLHMRDIHKRYRYFTPVAWVKEALLVPFYVERTAVGTIWAVIHCSPDNANSRKRYPDLFDLEDLRILTALGEFATAAYQVWIRSTKPSDAPPHIAPPSIEVNPDLMRQARQ